MHLSLALLVLLFSLILSNVINRIFPRLPLPLIQIIFGVGIGFLFKGRAFELETELFLAFIIAPLLFREGEESDITSILRNWKLILFLIFPVIFVSTLGIGYLAKAVLPASVPLSACLAIGAALGPTDLVAYSAISKRFSFPKWISYILQGEGLLNDASGLVAFQVAVTALTTGAFSLIDASWNLVISVIGGFLVGLILGDVQTGLIVGGTYQLMTIGNMPVGGAQPPNAVIGGIMSAVFAITTKLEPMAAVAAAIPFSLLGQYAVTIIFTIMSPVMATADAYAEKADPKGIARINYGAMAALGLFFGVIVTLFFLGGAAFGTQITTAIPKWLMNALSVAGGMMRFVGFAILLKVMVSRELWGFFLMGFAAAIVFISIPELSGPALLLLALIGFGIAFWDYQLQTKMKNAAPAVVAGGDFEDGI